MNIVVTGANGQLGSELKVLAEQDRGNSYFFLDRKALPLDQRLIIQDILGIYQPDLIIHCAAYTAVDKAEQEPELADAINHLATEEIAQYCRLNQTKLIAISTDYVFDGSSRTPLREDESPAPVNTYGLTKLKGEQAIQKWCPEGIIIRTSWVYSTFGNNFVKTIIRLMTEKEKISVINDQIGSPTYAKDLAQAILDIIHSDNWVGGIYHYSGEGAISWYDFAIAIRDACHLSCEITPIPSSQYPTPAKRPEYSLLDKSKIKSIFKVKVPYWADSLQQMLKNLNTTKS